MFRFGQSFEGQRARARRVAATVALMLGLSFQFADLRAELLFRSLSETNGQQRWSPIKKYSNPSDTAYDRSSAGADEVRVFLTGDITRQDVEGMAVMTGLLRSGKQKISGNTVWLASTGGDMDAAMELGRQFRKLGVFTVVGKNDKCVSACVFAFMGGERRMVAGQLAIHRPYFPYTREIDRQARFRHMQRVLRDYVEELDFPASLYEAVMLVPPESVQVLAAADLKRFYLEGISPSSEDIADAASARRLDLSMFEYLKLKASAPACGVLISGHGQCERKVQEAAARGGAADDPEAMPKSGGAVASRRGAF